MASSLTPSLARAGRALCQRSVTSDLTRDTSQTVLRLFGVLPIPLPFTRRTEDFEFQPTNGSSFHVSAGFASFEAVAGALELKVR